MSNIKNKDGSVNWANVKVNSVKQTTWGISIKPTSCYDAIDEIIHFLNRRVDLVKKWLPVSSDPGYWYGVSDTCLDTIDFIDKIIKL